MPIKIDYEKCCWKDGKCVSCNCGGEGTACKGCVEACSTGALTREDIVKFNPEKCTECGLCIEACEHDAISME